MVRITIKTTNKNGTPEFPLRIHTLRFPVISSMKDSEIDEEVKKFESENPSRKVVEVKKDILHYSADQEAMEMSQAVPRKPSEPLEEPL